MLVAAGFVVLAAPSVLLADGRVALVVGVPVDARPERDLGVRFQTVPQPRWHGRRPWPGGA